MYNNGNSATGNRAVSKLLVVLLSVAICAAFMPLLSDSVDAAGKKPGKVKKVTVSVDKNNKVSVKWKKAKKAKKYEVKVTDGKSKLVASKKTKKKKFSFNGQANTKYTVKVRGIKGKKAGKWSDAKSVKTGKSQGQKNSEKALAEAKAALEQAQKDLKDAQDALEQAKKDHDTDQQTISDLEQNVKDLEDLVDEKAEEVAEAQTASDIVKAIEDGALHNNDKVLELKEAYDSLSPEAQALIPAEMVKELNDKAEFVDRQRANGFLVDAIKLSAAKILDECDTWGPEDYNKYANRVEKAIDIFDNDLTLNQQLLVGFEIRNRLEACQFALEKAAAIVDLNVDYNTRYLRNNYFKAEREAISEILDGKYEGEELVEKGAIDLIKEAETSNDIYEIVNDATTAIGQVKTKPEVVTAMISDLSPKYDVITAENAAKATDAVAAIEEKCKRLNWEQKKEVENFDLLTAVDNRVSAYYITNGRSVAEAKDAAKTAIAYGLEAVDYYDEDWSEVESIITNGNTAIDAATTIDEINAAVAGAFDDIEAVPTKVKTVRAMVENLVEKYLDNLDDENIDEAREDAAAVEDAYDNDLNESQQEQLYVEKDGLKRDVYKLIKQLDNYDLDKAKYDAKAELEEYYAYEDAYFERAWNDICGIIDDGIEDIDDVTLPKDPTKEDVEAAIKAVDDIVLDAEKAIDAIPTKPEVVTKRIDKLYDYYNKHGLSMENYEEMKDWTEDVREMFEGLTEEEQEAVENIEDLETVEAAIEREAESIVTVIENKIEAINDLKDLVKGRNVVFAAAEAYYSVGEDLQSLVSNADVLKSALDSLEIEWPERISARILALYDTVDKYDSLTPDEQEEFEAELEAVRAELAEYDAAREYSGVDNRVVKKYRQMLESIDEDVEDIEDMIDDLDYVMDLTLDSDEEDIEAAAEDVADAREAFDSANGYVRDKVDRDGYLDALEDAEKHMENLEEAAEIEGMIEDLDYVQELTLDDGEEAIEEAAEEVAAARAAYDAYLDEYEGDVLVRDDAVEALELAEAKIEALNIEAMADELNDPEDVTIADKDAIEEAIGEYVENYEEVKQFIGKNSDTYNKIIGCGAALLNAMTEPLMDIDPADPTEVEPVEDDIAAVGEEYFGMPGAVQKAFKAEYNDAYKQLKALLQAIAE